MDAKKYQATQTPPRNRVQPLPPKHPAPEETDDTAAPAPENKNEN